MEEPGPIRISVTTRQAAYHPIVFPPNMWMTDYQGYQEENFCPGNLHCSHFQIIYKVTQLQGYTVTRLHSYKVTQFFYTVTPVPKLHKNLAKKENCRPIFLMNMISKILQTESNNTSKKKHSL